MHLSVRRVRPELSRALVALAGLAAALPAHAVLGGTLASIDADRARVGGALRVTTLASVAQVHTVVRPDGFAIREYAGPDGVVFAIAWQARVKPDLRPLLGAWADAYERAARRALATPGVRHRAVLEEGDLVVESAAHLNAYVGRAYLRSRVPGALPSDAIR